MTKRCPRCGEQMEIRELWSRAFLCLPFYRWMCKCGYWETSYYETEKAAKAAGGEQ